MFTYVTFTYKVSESSNGPLKFLKLKVLDICYILISSDFQYVCIFCFCCII